MSTYAVTLPGRDTEVACATEGEVRATLEAYRADHPKTVWLGVQVHEMRSGGTSANERSVYDFIDDRKS